MEALRFAAAECLQACGLAGVLDALGQRREPEVLRHGDDRAHDAVVAAVLEHVAHEGAVDLQRVHREALEIRQGRIARAEVVDGEREACFHQRLHDVHGTARVAHHARFGELDLEARRGQCRTLDDRQRPLGKVLFVDLVRGDVDGDAGRQGQPSVAPCTQLAAGLGQHPFAQAHHHAAFLDDGQEVCRRHPAPVGIVPAQQRFDAGERAVGQRNLGLVVQLQAAVVQCLAEALHQLEVAAQALAHLRAVEAVAAAGALGAVHGDVGMLDQVLHAGGVVRIDRDADAGAKREIDAAHADGLAHFRQQAERDGLRALAVGVVGDYDEFVAAEPGQQLVLAHRVAESAGDFGQHPVAGLMALGVVDLLEAVQVNEQQRQRMALRACEREFLLQAFAEVAAVRQFGQGVVVGELFDAAVAALALRDILHRADRPVQPAFGVLAEFGTFLEPARFAVDLDAVLDLVGLALAGGVPGGFDTFAVLGMDACEEVSVGDTRADRDAEQAIGFLRPFERLGIGALRLDAPAADAGDGLRLAEQGFAAGETLFGLQA